MKIKLFLKALLLKFRVIFFRAIHCFASGVKWCGCSTGLGLIGIFLAFISVKITYEIYIKDDLRRERDALERALTGSGEKFAFDESEGKFLDALFQFSQDPHVYPLSWKNFGLVNRNIFVPVNRFASDDTKEKRKKFSLAFVAATRLVYTDGNLKGFGEYCEPAMETLAAFGSTKDLGGQCKALCSPGLENRNFSQFFPGDRKLIHAFSGGCEGKSGDSLLACELSTCLVVAMRMTSSELFNAVDRDLLKKRTLLETVNWLFLGH